MRGDFDDPASLAAAVAGADTVFLLTAPAAPSARHDLALLDAARAASVGRVVRLSAIGTGEPHGDRTVGADHDLADQAVQASGLDWTLLRPTTFASNTLWWADAIRAGVPVPNLLGDGRQGIVDPADVAAVAAEVLAAPGPDHTGRVHADRAGAAQRPRPGRNPRRGAGAPGRAGRHASGSRRRADAGRRHGPRCGRADRHRLLLGPGRPQRDPDRRRRRRARPPTHPVRHVGGTESRSVRCLKTRAERRQRGARG